MPKVEPVRGFILKAGAISVCLPKKKKKILSLYIFYSKFNSLITLLQVTVTSINHQMLIVLREILSGLPMLLKNKGVHILILEDLQNSCFIFAKYMNNS